MPTVLDTVVEYEDKLVELVQKAQQPVADTVRRAADAAAERLPEVDYPAGAPSPYEVVESQIAFARKLLDAQSELLRAILDAVAPVGGYEVPAKARSTKAAKSARSTKPAAA